MVKVFESKITNRGCSEYRDLHLSRTKREINVSVLMAHLTLYWTKIAPPGAIATVASMGKHSTIISPGYRPWVIVLNGYRNVSIWVIWFLQPTYICLSILFNLIKREQDNVMLCLKPCPSIYEIGIRGKAVEAWLLWWYHFTCRVLVQPINKWLFDVPCKEDAGYICSLVGNVELINIGIYARSQMMVPSIHDVMKRLRFLNLKLNEYILVSRKSDRLHTTRSGTPRLWVKHSLYMWVQYLDDLSAIRWQSLTNWEGG